MTTLVQSDRPAPNPSRYDLRSLHVFTLCGFAFTVPILTILARQPVYIHDQQFGWTEIGALLFGLALCLPLGFVLLDRLALVVSKRLRGWGRNTVLFGLFGLVLLSMFRPYTSAPWIAFSGFAGWLATLLALVGAAAAVFWYEKSSGMRLWLTIAASGLVVFPGVFLYQFYLIHRPASDVDRAVVARHPTPVVMVVFDEFSGTTLLNDKLQIDARRFPQFARLAGASTFYRNATTVHPRTRAAVPAILSGRFPVTDLPPLPANYPANLFETIQSTRAFDMAVFEPVTRLCPKLARHDRPQPTALQKTGGLIRTLSTIYPRLILAQDLPIDLPAIPWEWFSIDDGDPKGGPNRPCDGLFNYVAHADRSRQLDHFLDCIKRSARPRFTFLHVELPHVPWVFLPTGEQYLHEFNDSTPAGAAGGLGEDWLGDSASVLRSEFRYRLQVGCVDRFVGRLLDRLVETGVWDKCLLIVTADHGVSFRPGHSRRLPDADNLADIASVPLFIKLPGQNAGRIDDRNVESVDIFPTIAESLGIDLPEPVDGIPVSQERRRPRKTLYYDKSMTVIEPELPQRRAAVLRQFEPFGRDKLEQFPPRIATRPEWQGRAVAGFVIKGAPVRATLIDPLRDRSFSTYTRMTGVETSPSFLKGEFDASDLPEAPAELVVAVAGLVRDSEMTFPRSGNGQGFEFFLPKSALRDAANSVRLYLVDRSHNPPSLRPVSISSDDSGQRRTLPITLGAN